MHPCPAGGFSLFASASQVPLLLVDCFSEGSGACKDCWRCPVLNSMPCLLTGSLGSSTCLPAGGYHVVASRQSVGGRTVCKRGIVAAWEINSSFHAPGDGLA
jgi:hypothetical protein